MIDIRRYMDIFIDGAREQIEAIDEGLRHVEAGSEEGLQAVRRAWHTLKGMAATMDQAPIAEMCHLAESMIVGTAADAAGGDTALLRDALLELQHGLDCLEENPAAGTVPVSASLERLRSRVHGERRPENVTHRATEHAMQAVPRRIRVSTDDLDAVLADLAELQAAAAALAPNDPGSHPLADRLVRGLGRVSRRISIMRLVPFALVVPTLEKALATAAHAAGRQARLTVRGHDTRIDRATLEALVEPIVHLLRNAVAHGAQTTAVRREADKPEALQLTVEVHLDRHRLRVNVRDDGPGVDLDAVARRLGLAEAQRQRLHQPGRDLADVLCRPGVSTRHQVSELAGRGVGLDAVRQCMVRAGGTLRLTSWTGGGVLARLDLRPQIAVTPCLVAECAGTLYGLPLGCVVSTDAAPLRAVSRARGVIDAWNDGDRGRSFPARPLVRILSDREEWEPPERVAVIKLALPGRPPFGVVVDGVVGNLSAPVRPLPAALDGERWLGTALRGDGRPVAIIDPVWLASRAVER